MKATAFHGLCISFLGGVFAASFLSASVAMLGAAPIAACAIYCALSGPIRKRPLWRAVGLFLAMTALFCAGVLRFAASESDDHPLDRFLGETGEFHGRICAEPEDREFDQRFCFAPDEGGDRILVRMPRFPRRQYGEMLTLTGKIELPENFEAYEGGPEFDYVSYLKKDSIRYVMSRPSARRSGEREASLLIRFLIWTKASFMGKVARLIPEPAASLVGGILLGEKGFMPADVALNFKRTGLTHILVLSGSNVTVVAEGLLSAFSFMPRMYGQGLGAFSIVLFAIMTGASTTTVRATFMALIGLLARGTGRRYDVLRALSIAAVAMVLHNPRILAFDISFQLSFLATLAIIYASPLVKERLGWVTERFGIRETLAMTLGTQIFTLPFIIYKMGEISVVALVPNLLVLPLVPFAMLGGFLAGMVGLVSEPLALPLAWMTRAMLGYAVWVVDIFGNLLFATIKARFSAPLLGLSYAAMALLIWRLRSRPKDSSRRSPN